MDDDTDAYTPPRAELRDAASGRGSLGRGLLEGVLGLVGSVLFGIVWSVVAVAWASVEAPSSEAFFRFLLGGLMGVPLLAMAALALHHARARRWNTMLGVLAPILLAFALMIVAVLSAFAWLAAQ